MSNKIILRALETELHRVMEEMDLTNDQIAWVYRNCPESHVFYPSDMEDMCMEVVDLVMDKDIATKIAWINDTIQELEHGLPDCDGYATMAAEMEAERRAGC